MFLSFVSWTHVQRHVQLQSLSLMLYLQILSLEILLNSNFPVTLCSLNSAVTAGSAPKIENNCLVYRGKANNRHIKNKGKFKSFVMSSDFLKVHSQDQVS